MKLTPEETFLHYLDWIWLGSLQKSNEVNATLPGELNQATQLNQALLWLEGFKANSSAAG